MYNYTNSLSNNLRTAIQKVGENPQSPALNQVASQNSSGEIQSMPAVTPDFNVVVPTGYTKTGVQKLRNGQEIHCYKLNNGQKVYIAPSESAMTTLNTYVNTGSMNEKDSERGISHFCEHMMFNGTKGTDNYMKLGVGDVFRKVEQMGGYANASTGHAETNYTISIPQFNKDDFETIVKMQSAMLNNSEMSDSMVDKEHGPVCSEINMYSDMPSTIVQNTAIKNLYNINSSSDDVIAGTVNNVLNIDRNKVLDYMKNNYYPANMSTVVTGDVNPDEAIEIIAKNFRGQNPQNIDRRFEPLKPIEKTVRKDILSSKAVGTTGAICFNGPAYDNLKDNVAISVINRYLFNKKNSKVGTELKDYNVDVHSNIDKFSANPKDGRIITIQYDSTEENSEIALRNIFNNLVNFQPPTQKELDNLKTEIKMVTEKNYENGELLNLDLGNNVLTGNIDNTVNELDALDSLTPQDLVNAVHKYFDINKASVAVIHPDDLANANTINDNYKKAQNVSFKGLEQNNTVSQKSNKLPIKEADVNQYTLNNNLQVAMMNSKNDIADYSLAFKPKFPANVKAGTVSLLTTMLSNRISKFKDFTNNNNISLNVSADENYMVFDAEVPAKNLDASMNLMKEVFANPDLSQENFEEAKKKVINDLMISQPNAYDNSLSTLFPDSPRGYTNKDVLKNIENVKLADVVGLYKYLTDDSSAACSASLPVEKYPEVKIVFDNQLSGLKPMKPVEYHLFNDFKPVEKTKVVTDAANTAQADVVELFKFYNNHSPKSNVANAIVKSILSKGDETGLFNNLREKEKLAYSVYSDLDISQNSSSVLSCNILTTTDSPDMKSYDNVQKSIDGFNRQIGKMINGEFTDEELKTAKMNLKRSLLEQNDMKQDKVMNLSDTMLNSQSGAFSANRMYELIDTITKEDIVNASRNIFSQKPIYSIRASQATLDANKEYLEKLEG